MKTFITKTIAVGGMALLLLSACQKDGQLTSISSGSTKTGALTASTTTPALVKANLTATAVTFTASTASYGYASVVSNVLQFDVKGDNFANVKKEVTLDNSALTQSYNVQDFNNVLLGMNLPIGVSAQVEVRLKSSLSTSAGIVYSNVITITATPFALTSYIYAVGAFQGWNISNVDSLVSATGNGVYVGIINFTTAKSEFLIVPKKNYDNKYATTEPTGGNTTSTIAYNAANNITGPAAGQYLITLDINAKTITFAPANIFSVIGSTTAGGNYSTDVDFTKYVNDVNGYWTLTLAQTAGAFKVRLNHDWGTSWGDIKPADGKSATSKDGVDIPVAVAGNYKVTFTTTPTAIGTKPAETATYTLVKQ